MLWSLHVNGHESCDFKITRWMRIKKYILSLNFGLMLAVAGGTLANWIIIRHLNLVFWESLVEGLGFGFVLGYLIRD